MKSRGMRKDDMEKVTDTVILDDPEAFLEKLGVDNYHIDPEDRKIILDTDDWRSAASKMGKKVYATMTNFPQYGWWWCRGGDQSGQPADMRRV